MRKETILHIARHALFLLCTLPMAAQSQTSNVIDEVIWVVGDEAILKSDVETMRLQAEQEGIKWNGDPDCAIPEQLAVQKLFLHQAAIDSIEVTESEVSQRVEEHINYMIQIVGSREKLEEYRNMTLTQLRNEMHDEIRNRLLIENMKNKLVADIKVTPSDVRRYFNNLPEDSIPFVPTEVEVQIITQLPKIEEEEINRVKNELREYTDRVMNGETQFSTLARLYSEDPGSARQGGEMDYVGRAILDPAFASVAFNLTDPKKVSKVVESEFGFHIIQLIDKRGDKVKVRHILRKPHVSDAAIDAAISRLDSIADDIRSGKITFEKAAMYVSDDKDTRNNRGNMFYTDNATRLRTSKFQLKNLPAEIAKVVDTLEVGKISNAFSMMTERGKTQCVIAKLKNRIEGHRATITEDFQVMKDVVLAKRREETIKKWVSDKLKSTYIRIDDRYKNCTFEYDGWIK